jgi:hypothetical protein
VFISGQSHDEDRYRVQKARARLGTAGDGWFGGGTSKWVSREVSAVNSLHDSQSLLAMLRLLVARTGRSMVKHKS